MTDFLDEELLNQIRLERVENGIIEDVLTLIEEANKKVKEFLLKSKGVFTKKRYEQISSYLKDVSKELKEKIENGMSFQEFVDYEMTSQKKIFSKHGISLDSPSKEQIITSSLFMPYADTSTFKSFLDSVELRFYNTWDSAIRKGYMLGIPTEQIVKDIMGEMAKNAKVKKFGLLEPLRNSVKTNTRTILQAMANETRIKIFKKNEDLFSGYRYYATLDRNVCIICGRLDGEFREHIEDFGVSIPVHFNCRCIIIPVVKGFEDLEDTRASEDGYISDKVKFSDWLENQEEDTQKYILGKSRFKEYEKNKNLNQFVSNNKIIPLKKLK